MKVDTLMAPAAPAIIAEQAAQLEAKGFDCIWTFEASSDPFIPLAHAAAATSRIEIGTNIIELHTGEYCNSVNTIKELDRINKAAKYATDNNIETHAGHGLNFDNVIDIAKISYIKELNIGHFLIGESIFMGLEGAVKKMRNIIDNCK